MAELSSVTRIAAGIVLAACLLSAGGLGSVRAQGTGCTLTEVTGTPPRSVLRCPGLVIEAERSAQYQLLDRDRNQVPDAARLNQGALLIEYSGGKRDGFQILTPHAIASVRGTSWAVDVKGVDTAVLVVTGRVDVRRPTASRGVVLQAGQGVDVGPGSGPLEVKTWGAPRVRALLARFGR
ncbi:ferric-dicitrate binding protein FerR (iron transport regulator) [Rhodoligotrophos appendicifer]|uniref:FecR domain-containing protein n=1 Tax=Rhodoligotrophos appendicifer TaxID=987056 RepID=UPI00118728DC|nr:FecR domain-containing protein [Rhodoligotrophos appendicifer]